MNHIRRMLLLSFLISIFLTAIYPMNSRTGLSNASASKNINKTIDPSSNMLQSSSSSNLFSDYFNQDSGLNYSVWSTNDSNLQYLAVWSAGYSFISPTLNFNSNGMEMSGTTSSYQFTGIQTLETFATQFTLTANVEAIDGNAQIFEIWITNEDFSNFLMVRGDYASGYYGMGYTSTSSGSNGVSVFYNGQQLNTMYTITIIIDAKGTASISFANKNGVVLGTVNRISVGNGPFYISLCQAIGAVVGAPQESIWNDVTVSPSVVSTTTNPSNNDNLIFIIIGIILSIIVLGIILNISIKKGRIRIKQKKILQQENQRIRNKEMLERTKFEQKQRTIKIFKSRMEQALHLIEFKKYDDAITILKELINEAKSSNISEITSTAENLLERAKNEQKQSLISKFIPRVTQTSQLIESCNFNEAIIELEMIIDETKQYDLFEITSKVENLLVKAKNKQKQSIIDKFSMRIAQTSKLIESNNYDRAIIELEKILNETRQYYLPEITSLVEKSIAQSKMFKELTKMLKISKKLRIDDICAQLERSRGEIMTIFIDWGENLGVTIDGDFVTINDSEKIDSMIGDLLRRAFEDWSKKEKTKEGKI